MAVVVTVFSLTLQNRITWPATMNVHMHWKRSFACFHSLIRGTSLIFPAILNVCVCVCMSAGLFFSWMFPLFVAPSHSFFHWPISFSSFILYLSRNHFMYNWNVYVFLAFSLSRWTGCTLKNSFLSLSLSSFFLFDRWEPGSRECIYCGFIAKPSHVQAPVKIKNKKTVKIQKCQHFVLKNMKLTVEIKTRTMIFPLFCALLWLDRFFFRRFFFRCCVSAIIRNEYILNMKITGQKLPLHDNSHSGGKMNGRFLTKNVRLRL